MKKSDIAQICSLLNHDKSVRKKWSGHDQLVVENQLPYLCLYRYPEKVDEEFIEIVKTQPSYLIVSQDIDVKEMLFCLADTISSKMNAFMLFEMWPGNANSKTFKIFCPEGKAPATISSLDRSLTMFGESNKGTNVKVITEQVGSPPKLEPVATTLEESLQIGFLPVSLEIPPFYRKKDSSLPHDVYFRGIQSLISDTIKKAAFEFMRVQTPSKFNHHLMLGKTNISEAAIEIDKHLTDLSNRINFLLRVTPVNTERQWEIFQKKKYKAPPHFSYRLITLDPEAEKRALYGLRLAQVNDPAISFILREKRLELDKQLTMLEERGSHDFKYLSQSIYGVPKETLVKGARKILKEIDKKGSANTGKIDCREFAKLAQKEIKIFNKNFDEMELEVEIRKDISSLMVSKNKLLIGENVKISKRRASALIQHEVGTHLLTYCNGKRQVLGQLASGFAGYDDLQEGLAVLAEYLVGGLTAARLRTLASRVMAVDALVKGADFMEIFNLLTDKCLLNKRHAFHVSARVLRGGGLTKDAIYLSGLMDLLDYLKEGGDIEILYAGKFSFRHIPLVKELLHRDVFIAPILPSYFGEADFQKRLNKLRLEVNLSDLLY